MKKVKFLEHLPYIFLLFCVFYVFAKAKSVIIAITVSYITAYLLSPAKNMLRKILKKNSLSSFLTIIIFFSSFILITSIVLPILYQEFFYTIKFLYGNADAQKAFSKLFESSKEIELKVKNLDQNKLIQSDQIIKMIKGSLSIIMKIFYKSGKLALNIVSSSILTFFMSFFMLKDWEKINNFISKIVPKRFSKEYKEITFEINSILERYIRGQAKICLFVGIYYSISLFFVGVNAFLLIGFISGILCFIPYMGFSTSLVLCILTTINQDPALLINVAIIYLFGAIFENYICAPKLMGKQINLHPAWIIFSIFFVGNLFGFVGVLIAIPAAAISSVFLSHITKVYFKSNLYNKTYTSNEVLNQSSAKNN